MQIPLYTLAFSLAAFLWGRPSEGVQLLRSVSCNRAKLDDFLVHPPGGESVRFDHARLGQRIAQ
jgi:hypothetical protein